MSAPLSSAALHKRLLREGYAVVPQCPEQHDDLTVIGCPALYKLGGDITTNSSLNLPRKAKAAFA